MVDTWGSFFNKVNKSINKTTEEIAEEVLADWRELIWTEFYLDLPESTRYKRSYETINSLSFLKVNKVNGNIEIEIGYDDSKINTFPNSAGYYISHENPENMGSMFEWAEPYGIFGHEPIHAVDEMLKQLQSNWFKNKFKELMNKKGYIVK